MSKYVYKCVPVPSVLGVVVVAVGLAGILWFGVRDASSDPIDSLLGDWRTVNNGTTIAYTEDGKWSAQHGWWGRGALRLGAVSPSMVRL